MSSKTSEAVYEIRRDGRVWVRSSVPDCGYTAQQLRSLRAQGFSLHKKGVEKDGRR